MTSSWRATRSPRFYLVIGGTLLAVGLWDLFFVLFRSEDVLFTLSAALLLPLGSLNIWQGVTRLPGRKGLGV
jgi:hypothetical protein